MNFRKMANAGFGATRVGFGLVAGSAPEAIGRTWIGETAGGEPTRVILRALGVRDIALGAGTVDAAIRGRAAPWLAVSVVADLGDVLATLLARDHLPRRGVLTTSVIAGSAAVAGLGLLALESGSPGR